MTMLLAQQTTQRSIGLLVLVIVALGGVAYLVIQARKGRQEIGSEIELAANRKPYLDDDELETTKLDRSLMAAVGLLLLIAVALPLYWLAEPGRQAGAVKSFDEKFVEAGLEIYEQGAQCVNCHAAEGVGGVATFVITDEQGEFVDQVQWNAPALNTVLWRFSVDEVRYILNYGRPGTPMAAWGLPGGGPLTEQQIDQVIDYLWSVQLKPEEMTKEIDDAVSQIDKGLAQRMMDVRQVNEDKAAAYSEFSGTQKTVADLPLPVDPVQAKEAGAEAEDQGLAPDERKFAMSRLDEADELQLGEILFNLDVASGAYSCARCHVPGAAYGQGGETFDDLQYGAMGPRLQGIETRSTPNEHFEFIMSGSEDGVKYFSRSVGSGKMPGFGLNPNADAEGVPQLGTLGMYDPSQVWSVVTYERNLDRIPSANPDNAPQASPAAAPADAPDLTVPAAVPAGGDAQGQADVAPTAAAPAGSVPTNPTEEG
ncbi:MAG: cytochrome c [Candidatus Microthrix subdominans]